MISITNLEFKHDSQEIYNGLSLNIALGEVYAIFGKNGVGKTTLLELLSGKLSPDNGKIEGLSSDIMLIEDNMIPFKFMTGFSFVEFVLNLKKIKISSEHLISQASQLELSADDFKFKRILEYSKGMQYKLIMILINLATPHILLLDEPFSELDLKTNMTLSKMFFQKRREKYTVLTTHSIEVAYRFSTQIIYMDEGSSPKIIPTKTFDHLEDLECYIKQEMN